MQPIQPVKGPPERIMLSHGIPLPTAPFNYFCQSRYALPETQRKPLRKFREGTLPEISSVIYRQMLFSLSDEKLTDFLKKQEAMRESGRTEGLENLYTETFGAEVVKNYLEQTNLALQKQQETDE